VVGPDGSLWLADSEVDAITKVEIKSGTRTRWRPVRPRGSLGLSPPRAWPMPSVAYRRFDITRQTGTLPDYSTFFGLRLYGRYELLRTPEISAQTPKCRSNRAWLV